MRFKPAMIPESLASSRSRVDRPRSVNGVVACGNPTAPAHKGDKTGSALKLGANVAMLAGAGLIAWSAAIHLDLWKSSYRDIRIIGWLFLLQSIAGFVLATAVAVLRRLMPAAVGAAFLLATAGGLIWSAQFGLFGFQDSLNASFAHLSLAIEVTGALVLLGACLLRVMYARRSPSKWHGDSNGG